MKSSEKIIFNITLALLPFLGACQSPSPESNQDVSSALSIQDSLNEVMTKLDGNMKKIDSTFKSTVRQIENDSVREGENIFKNFKMDSIILDTSVKVMEYDQLFIHFNKKGALRDIEIGKINLLLPGGFMSAPELPNDSIFEKKYNVTFISQGCVRTEGENETEYNIEMFKYLDETYGRVWRKEVRDDVIGLGKR